jgi:DNA-binding NtrC family response regulator
MKKVLIIDDDAELRSHLSAILTEAGYQTAEAASGREGIERAIAEDHDVVLLDLIMPKMSGSDVLVELRKASPRSRIIMLTAFATIENAVDAMKRGASDYVSKPFKIDDLLTRVRRVLEEARVEQCSVKGNLDCILGSLSNPLRRMIIQVLSKRTTVRLMELVRELGVEDHTKVIFHLKILKEAGMIEQDKDKIYSLTKEGSRAVECLKTIENYLTV